jgi:hypothetical protein
VALLFAERAGAVAKLGGDGPGRLLAEATVVAAGCRLGRQLDVVERGIAAIHDAERPSVAPGAAAGLAASELPSAGFGSTGLSSGSSGLPSTGFATGSPGAAGPAGVAGFATWAAGSTGSAGVGESSGAGFAAGAAGLSAGVASAGLLVGSAGTASTLAWALRVELAGCARTAGVPLVGAAVLRPVLTSDAVQPSVRADALVQLVGCLAQHVDPNVLDGALAEADRLYADDRDVDADTRVVLRALLRSVASGEQRRRGDARAAVDAAQEGADLLASLNEPATDNGEVAARVALRLVHGLLDLGRVDEAGAVAAAELAKPVRAPAATAVGWLSLAVAVRKHLAAGAPVPALAVLREAAELAERHHLSALRAEALTTLSDAHERIGQLAEALDCLRTAQGVRLRRARAVYAARAKLISAFGETAGPAEFAQLLVGSGGRRAADSRAGVSGREHAAALLGRFGMRRPIAAEVTAAPNTDVAMVLVDLTAAGLIGDQVVSQVLDRVRDAAPSDAQVARVGGAELAVLLPTTRSAQAERLRGAIAEVDWATVAPGVNVNVRVAVAQQTGRQPALASVTSRTAPTAVAAAPTPAATARPPTAPQRSTSMFELPTVPIMPVGLAAATATATDAESVERATGQLPAIRSDQGQPLTGHLADPEQSGDATTGSGENAGQAAYGRRAAHAGEHLPDQQSAFAGGGTEQPTDPTTGAGESPGQAAYGRRAAHAGEHLPDQQSAFAAAGGTDQSSGSHAAPHSDRSTFGDTDSERSGQSSMAGTGQGSYRPPTRSALEAAAYAASTDATPPSERSPFGAADTGAGTSAQRPSRRSRFSDGTGAAGDSAGAVSPGDAGTGVSGEQSFGGQGAGWEPSSGAARSAGLASSGETGGARGGHAAPEETGGRAAGSSVPPVLPALPILPPLEPEHPVSTSRVFRSGPAGAADRDAPGGVPISADPSVRISAADIAAAGAAVQPTAEPVSGSTGGQAADDAQDRDTGTQPAPWPFTDPIGDHAEPSRPRHSVDPEVGRSVLSSLGITSGSASGGGRRRAREDAGDDPSASQRTAPGEPLRGSLAAGELERAAGLVSGYLASDDAGGHAAPAGESVAASGDPSGLDARSVGRTEPPVPGAGDLTSGSLPIDAGRADFPAEARPDDEPALAESPFSQRLTPPGRPVEDADRPMPRTVSFQDFEHLEPLPSLEPLALEPSAPLPGAELPAPHSPLTGRAVPVPPPARPQEPARPEPPTRPNRVQPPAAQGEPDPTRPSGRRRRSVQLADLLTEALMAYQSAQDSNEATDNPLTTGPSTSLAGPTSLPGPLARPAGLDPAVGDEPGPARHGGETHQDGSRWITTRWNPSDERQ